MKYDFKTGNFLKILFLVGFLFSLDIPQIAIAAEGDSPSSQSSVGRRAYPDFADLVEKTSPAVVNIRTTEKIQLQQQQLPPNFSPQDQAEFFRRFFGIPLPNFPQPQVPQQPQQKAPKAQTPQDQEQVKGTGSGFIIDTNGYILTNAHVVDGATTIYVTLTDKREFKAKLIGSDLKSDIALVKIEASNLQKLPIGESSKIRVGEWVLAIGSPFGLENTVSAGIISAKGRDLNDNITPFIQTDVAINPGNSGGPLINMKGEAIGINSQIFSKSGGYMGIAFAIPMDEAMHVADQLKANGKISRGRIGVNIGDVTKEQAEAAGLIGRRGVRVGAVEPGFPAALAGIEAGDIILKINDKDVERAQDLSRAVSEVKPGNKVKLQIWRKGALREMSVTVVDVDAARRT